MLIHVKKLIHVLSTMINSIQDNSAFFYSLPSASLSSAPTFQQTRRSSCISKRIQVTFEYAPRARRPDNGEVVMK